jgi:hypothetical protein
MTFYDAYVHITLPRDDISIVILPGGCKHNLRTLSVLYAEDMGIQNKSRKIKEKGKDDSYC